MELTAKTRACLFLDDQAEDAARFYVSLIEGSEIENVVRPDPDGPALVVEFALAGTPYMTLNGNPDVQCNHTFSISVLARDQAEVDALWERLGAGGDEGRCGWIQDRFGIHWQVVPEALPRLMSQGDPDQGRRVQAALMEMKKIEIAALEAAYEG